jgi:hypothetical protein
MLDLGALLRAYLAEALPFALLHLVLAIVCVAIWVGDISRFGAEKKALIEARLTGNPPLSSQIGKLWAVTASLADKGRFVHGDNLDERLYRATFPHEMILRTSINGFLIVGLIGTLMMLWQLGPSFWRGILEVRGESAIPQIGVAFSASIFGLAFALTFSVFDAAIIEPRRAQIMAEGSNWIGASAEAHLPSSTVTEIVKAYEAISLDLSARMSRIADDYTTAVITASEEWRTSLRQGVALIKNSNRALEGGAKKLGESMLSATQSVNQIADKVDSLRHLGNVVREIQDQTTILSSRVTDAASQMNEGVQRSLMDVASYQRAALAEQIQLAEGRLTDLMDRWHKEAATTLQRFANDLGKVAQAFSSDWGILGHQLEQSVSENIRRFQLSTEVEKHLVALGAAVGELNLQLQQVLPLLAEAWVKVSRLDTPPGDGNAALTSSMRDLQEQLRQTTDAINANSKQSDSGSSLASDLVSFKRVQQLQEDTASRLDKIAVALGELMHERRELNQPGKRPEMPERKPAHTLRDETVYRPELKGMSLQPSEPGGQQKSLPDDRKRATTEKLTREPFWKRWLRS